MAALQGGTDHGPARVYEVVLHLLAGVILSRESPLKGSFNILDVRILDCRTHSYIIRPSVYSWFVYLFVDT